VFLIECVPKNVEKHGSIQIGARPESVEDEVFPSVEIAGNKWLLKDNAFDFEASEMYVCALETCTGSDEYSYVVRF